MVKIHQCVSEKSSILSRIRGPSLMAEFRQEYNPIKVTGYEFALGVSRVFLE